MYGLVCKDLKITGDDIRLRFNLSFLLLKRVDESV